MTSIIEFNAQAYAEQSQLKPRTGVITLPSQHRTKTKQIAQVYTNTYTIINTNKRILVDLRYKLRSPDFNLNGFIFVNRFDPTYHIISKLSCYPLHLIQYSNRSPIRPDDPNHPL